MTATTEKEKAKKKKLLRYNEYYNTQEVFDKLYQDSVNNKNFKNLLEIIESEENIKLAYRTIKKNTGSNTKGVNDKTIKDIAEWEPEKYIKYVRKRLKNFTPHAVRRIEIPKSDGSTKMRPLGIPTIEDRLIQQSIKQVLEPIAEARFYKHSYGFRPNRSTHHAIARVHHLIHCNKLNYVVDVDIKGFFDNVNHGKLIKQMWSLGIRDKNLICIISKMLKAEIEGIGVPTKGVPQGGILSPLLSNIVLNELDWWIASQWDLVPTEFNYSNKGKRDRALRESKSNLKEIYIVRYADDFKIFCKTHNQAKRIFEATKKWLKERLGLDVSDEKSKITNLRTQYSEFLGVKFKVRPKKNKYVVKSSVSDKAKKKIENNLRRRIRELQKETTPEKAQRFNSTLLGIHNYYKVATDVNIAFQRISYNVSRTLYNRLRHNTSTGAKSKTYERLFGDYNFKTVNVGMVTLFPIAGISTKPPMNFKQEICNYTPEGRKFIHDNLKAVNYQILRFLMSHPHWTQSTEFNDNRISLYVAQKGLCAITKEPLEIGEMDVHHKKKKEDGGTDEYKNLIYLKSEIHRLIHLVDKNIIKTYLERLNLNVDQLKKVNKLRVMAGNTII